MNITRFFTELSLPQGVSFSSQATGLWTHGKNRVVSVMTSGPGIVAIGLIFMASIALAHRCVKRYAEYCKEQKIRKFVDNVAYVWTHRKDPTKTQRIQEIERLFKKEFGGNVVLVRGGGFRPFDYNAHRVLNLDGLALTDEHLQCMTQSGLFNDVECLNLGENPLLTGHGIAAMGQQGFSGLQHLILNNNRRLVETGFKEWIACKGFNELKSLDLYNAGITTEILEELIQSDWVKRLKGLDLRGDNKIETCHTITSCISLL